MLSPPGIAPVCNGDQLELMCTTPGSQLEWRFSVIRGNETNATEFSRIIVSSGPPSVVMPLLVVNSTTFNISRPSTEGRPVMSRLLINPVSNNLNGTVMNCVDVFTSELSSTTIVIIMMDSLQGIPASYHA